MRGVGPGSIGAGMTPGRALLVHLVGALGLGAALLVGLAVGPVPVDLIEAWFAAPDTPASVIVFGARLPRVLLAALVGGALGLAGAGLQALLHNPLACPHILGISGGAALAGILAMVLVPLPAVATLGVFSEMGVVAIPAAAFLGALVTAALVRVVAAASGRLTPHTLLLTGVVFNAFAAAVITLIGTLADFRRVQGILSWVIGALVVRGDGWMLVALATLTVGMVLLAATARDLNALALGDEGALALGVDVRAARRRVYLAVALLVAGAVPVSGMIGFVGLIVPHAVRSLVGSDQRRVLVASAWGGAVFLVLADTAARSLMPDNELPVGVVTALCGGPFFLYLLRRQGQREALGEA